jgi:hypothetical protein
VIHVEDQLTLTRHTTATSATRPPVLLVPPLAALASAFDLAARAPPIRRHTADGDTRRFRQGPALQIVNDNNSSRYNQ